MLLSRRIIHLPFTLSAPVAADRCSLLCSPFLLPAGKHNIPQLHQAGFLSTSVGPCSKRRARHGGITVYIAIRGCRYVPTCEQQAANKRRDAESLQFPVDLRSGLALSRPFQLSRKTTCLCPSKSQIVAPGLVTVGGGRPSEPTQLHPIAVARDQCLTTTIARRTGGLLPTSPGRPAPSWTRSPQVARPRHGAFYTIHPKIAHQLERVI